MMRTPRDFVAKHGVTDNQKLSHDGNQRYHRRLTATVQSPIETRQLRISLFRTQCGHVQCVGGTCDLLAAIRLAPCRLPLVI